jgi:DNA primase
MSGTAETIKDRLSIVDVIGSYIKLEHAGANLKARCPFHNEKTPSFFVSPARGSYYCFGCGVKGDIFSFVQEYEKVDFLGALKMLAERAGVELQEFKSDAHKKVERQYKVLDLATTFFQKRLDELQKEYLYSRGLTNTDITSWRIGYAEDQWRSLMDTMLRQSVDGQVITKQDLVDVGLIKLAEGDKVYDRFRSRIMFPIFDSSGRVIGFSGRIFGQVDESQGQAQAKYLNSPDTKLFNKSEVLYGFDKAKQAMRERGYAVLVEGQLDLLLCHQAGIKNAVATSGTALTDGHLMKISRMTRNILFMYDGDKAGYGATRRGERLAIEQGFDVKVVTLPQGEDPASLIQKDKQAFIRALKESTHVVPYYLAILQRMHPESHDLMKAIEKDLVPDIALTPSAIRRAELISLVSMQTKIPEKALTEEVEKCIAVHNASARDGNAFSDSDLPEVHMHSDQEQEGGSNEYDKKVRKVASSKSVDVVLRRTLALILYMESKGENGATYRNMVKSFLSKDDQGIADYLIEHEKDELLFEAEMLFGNDSSEKHLSELMIELEERALKSELTILMSSLQLAEKAKDKVQSDEIIKKCQDISLKLSELNTRRNNRNNGQVNSKP